MAEQHLIDANELITAFPCGETVRTECVRATIEHMPTIEERKKGKWIEITDHEIPIVCKCTECGWLTTHYDSFLFCPNCGAMMEGRRA